MINALELMFRRMDTINAICTTDFPLYSSKNINAWIVSFGGSWMGVFWGCCYKTRQGEEELVESVWGNFFLMAALAALMGFIEPGHC